MEVISDSQCTPSFMQGVTQCKNEEKHVTDIADLRSYANGQIIELPQFAEGMPFVARLRRPSMLFLAKTGQIPNTLLAKAGQLFNGGGASLDTDDVNMLSDVYDIVMVILKASLVSPTIDEIHDAGIELSDDQIMAIFNYTQGGVKALEQFRS